MSVFQISDHQSAESAIVDPTRDLSISYDELRERVDRLAAGLLASGVRPGQRVVVVSYSGVEAAVGFLAVLRAGATALPLNPQLTSPEILRHLPALAPDHALTHATPGALEALVALGVPVTEIDATQPLQPGAPRPVLPEPDPQAIALILQTSGTTGGPKSVPLSQANLAASTATIGSTYDLGPQDTSFCIMPLFHVHGLIGVALSTLATGGTVVMPSRHRMGAFWENLATHEATWCSAVPTMLAAIPGGAPGPGSRLRFLRSASSPLPPTVAGRLETDTGLPVLEAYGMTEATHQIASNPLPPGVRVTGSVGLPTGTELAVVDESWRRVPQGDVGEVVVRGASVTAGYLDNPEANAAAFRDRWFRTGDLGRLAPSGHLALVGRVKEMINRGGEKISPREVDETLLSHPAVLEAATYGVPDAKYGEVVHAVVVIRDPVLEGALVAHCRQQLATFKVPRTIHVVDAIPKGPTGKVQRNTLAKALDGS